MKYRSKGALAAAVAISLAAAAAAPCMPGRWTMSAAGWPKLPGMKSLIAAAGLALGLLAVPVQAQTRRDYYHSRYFLLGTYLRGGNVCNSKQMIEYGFNLVSSQEFRRFSAAYPKTLEQWTREGGENFNRLVMQDGIPAACRVVTEMMARK